jgi:phage terminase large subunit
MHLCFFNEKTTEAGRDALGYYHERRDDNRNVGLGPEHDWSSNASDSFGLMATCYEGPDAEPTIAELFEQEQERRYADATRSEITGY